MTRINCGIPPAELTNKHLIAEHRELKRIPNCIRKGRYSLKGQPEKFTLGVGHIKFFYSKLLYLKKRYEQLYLECKNRGFNITYFGGVFEGLPSELMGSYTPSAIDRAIVMERINERLGK